MVIDMKWSKEEIDYLKTEYSKIDGKSITNIVPKIAKKLKRTEASIRNKAYKLKITHREKYYTNEEINFLEKNYDKLSMDDMSTILKKDKSNICRKMKELGLKKTKRTKNILNPKKPHYWTDEEKAEMSKRAKKKYMEKGLSKKFTFKGHKHNKKSLEKISNSSKEFWENVTLQELENRKLKQRETRLKNGTLNPMKSQKNPYSRTKSGKRKDLNNIFFRSAWEANIARYYNYLGIEWQFEPKTFIFKNISRGSVSYTPDFYLPQLDKWVEVKGWMDNKSKTKLKRFKNQYPKENEKLELITQKEYDKIKKEYSNKIENWE